MRRITDSTVIVSFTYTSDGVTADNIARQLADQLAHAHGYIDAGGLKRIDVQELDVGVTKLGTWTYILPTQRSEAYLVATLTDRADENGLELVTMPGRLYVRLRSSG